MATNLTYPAVQARMDELRPAARRHRAPERRERRGYEARVRLMIRRAPPRPATHPARRIPLPSPQ